MTNTTPKLVACPRCKKPSKLTKNPYRPFCSERCQLIDLGAWADESYKISGQHSDDLSLNSGLVNSELEQLKPYQ